MDKLQHIQQTLSWIEKDIKSKIGKEYSLEDFEMYSFTQLWPTPDLGFVGLDEDAPTLAYTYVFIPTESNELNIGYVYFENKFAYTVNPKNKNVKHDLEKHAMGSVLEAKRYQ